MSKKSGGAKKRKADGGGEGIQLIAKNRKVHHQYEILDKWEAGIQLQGSEVKSLRASDLQWADAHARFDHRHQLWLYGLYIGTYSQATYNNHVATRQRKLLMHRRELDRLEHALRAKGLTVVPRSLYFKDGIAKVEICLVRGKKHEDKRADLKDRATRRDIDREMARRAKG
jgi:SsrA-binding protein